MGSRLLLVLLALFFVAGCQSAGLPTISCVPACPHGTTCTSDGCIPEGELPGRDAAAPSQDLGGGCAPACSGATPFCNANQQCVPCLADPDCPPGSVCRPSGIGTLCTPGCRDDSRCGASGRCCDGACTDVTTDPSNCGACGTACASLHAASVCVDGVCTAGQCTTGWGDCDRDPSDGCETNLLTDPSNCTQCGTRCSIPNAVSGCANGCYVAACKFGFDDCNGLANDGCETSVLVDSRNCGACGHPCTAPPHASAACINAICQITGCQAGFADCDLNPVNGCEATIFTDSNNCGKCNAACGQGLVCRNGGCTCVQCNFAHATSKCLNNVCVLDQCVKGYSDCNGDPNDGCEAPTGSDPKNCGACGMACPNGLFCIDSQCVMTTCGDGMLQAREEFDPPPGPFMSVSVDKVTCRWQFQNVSQFYCNGACSWVNNGNKGCDQANADMFCKLRTGNPNSTAMAFQLGTATANPGFPCPTGAYGKNLGQLPTRGVLRDVYYQDSSLMANHGAGQVIINPTCTDP